LRDLSYFQYQFTGVFNLSQNLVSMLVPETVLNIMGMIYKFSLMSHFTTFKVCFLFQFSRMSLASNSFNKIVGSIILQSSQSLPVPVYNDMAHSKYQLEMISPVIKHHQ